MIFIPEECESNSDVVFEFWKRVGQTQILSVINDQIHFAVQTDWNCLYFQLKTYS